MVTIGFLELNSIARGLMAVDTMLKAAEVKLIFAKPCCPGKYSILVSGDISAVEASVESGIKMAGSSLINSLLIPRIHPQVIEAMHMTTVPEQLNAVGVIECFSITAAVQAADTAVKGSEVTLLELRLGTGIGGKSFVVMTGDVSSVQAGVESGSRQAMEDGMLVNQVVIPSPHRDLFLRLY